MTRGRPRVKLCGLTSEEDVDLAVAAGADALGFVTEVPVETHRNLDVERTASLVEHAPPLVTTVAVVMPRDVEHALEMARESQADAVQIHDPGFPASELETTGAKLIQRVEPSADRARSIETPSGVDAVILDSTDSEGAGGTGETADWGVAARLVEALDLPVVLAGGLTPDNVSAAVERVRPYAVDVSSGVERDGRKHPGLVESFVERARSGGEA